MDIFSTLKRLKTYHHENITIFIVEDESKVKVFLGDHSEFYLFGELGLFICLSINKRMKFEKKSLGTFTNTI